MLDVFEYFYKCIWDQFVKLLGKMFNRGIAWWIDFTNELILQNVLSCLFQEEYQAEGITWHNIDYTDNVGCIHLISKKPTGLLYLLDEESK